jgi:tetratricopeptide (TPR) repeat protein
MHERIGLLLEAQPSARTAERYALLAHHFARSDNRRKAIETLLEAARLTEALPSYRTATDLYRQAWQLGYTSLAEGADVDDDFRRLVLAASLDLCRMAVIYVAPDSLDIEKTARFGRDLAEAIGDVQSAAGFRAYHGMIAMSGGSDRFAEGFALVESGYALAEKNGLAETALSISRALAFGCLYDGQIARAREIRERLIEAIERRGHHERLTDVYFGIVWLRNSTLVYAGDDALAAIADARSTHDLAVQAGNRTARSGMASVLAQLHFIRGDYDDARRWADESLEIAEAIGNVTTVRSAAAIALGARTALGESFDRSRHLRGIEEGFAMSSNLSLYVRVVVDALLSSGELRLAERAARTAYDRAGGRLRFALASIALGDVLSHLGEDAPAEAIVCYERAAAVAKEIGVRAPLAHAELGLGRLAAAAGRNADRDQWLRRAHATFVELGLRRYAVRAERLLASRDLDLAESA